MRDYDLEKIVFVALGSVVPELTRIWLHLFQKYSAAQVIEINAYTDLGLKYMVPDPGFIGSDLVANAYCLEKIPHQLSCHRSGHSHPANCDCRRAFVGTAIAPGLKTGASFLFENAALLSEIELSHPPATLGTNTKDALLSGIVSGHAMMLESYVARIKQEYPNMHR